MKAISIKAQIKKAVHNYMPDAKVYLYGSRARNKSNKLSDWDVLILLNEENISSDLERKIAHSLYDIEFDTGELISPMIYTYKDWETKYKVTPFYKNIVKEMIEL